MNSAKGVVRFVDSHAHLADPAFDADREVIVENARAAGARAVICIGESPAAASRAAQLAERHPKFIWFTAGVHPHDAESFDAHRDGDAIRALAARGAVAVGECGLDYHYDNSPRLLQRRAFARQLELARELALPVVVHTRDAEEDTAAMLKEASKAGVLGVLHCFTGSATLAQQAVDAGWYIALSGIITFPKFAGAEMVCGLPDSRILVESDSPYLAPIPHRGKRNVPAWVGETVAKLASLRNNTSAEMARITSDNAAALFGVAFATAH